MRRYWIILLLLASAGCAPPAERPAGPRPPFELMRAPDGAAEFGRSFLRRRDGVFEARFEGGPYERGYARGRLAYDQIVAGETDLDFLLRQMVPSAFKRWIFRELLASTMRRSEKYIGRGHLEEIAGLADAEVPDPFPAGWRAYARQLSLHALHDFSQRFIDTVPLSGACSGFAANGRATADGHVYLARNFDFEAGTRFDREKIVAAVVPASGNAYLSVTFGGLTGVVSGFNSRGLAVSLQSLSGGPTQSAGKPATLLAADVLESDATVEEAIARLRDAKVLVSDIYLLADSQGHLAAVEKTPQAVGIRRAETILAATNVPRTPEVSAVLGPPPPVSTSEYRQRRLEELLSRYATGAGRLTAASAAGILRDRNGMGGRELGPGNRNAIDALIACHSVIFDLTARRAYVAASPHTLGRYVAFDLDLLSKAEPGDPRFAGLARESLPEDPLLASGGYARYRKARQKLRDARRDMARKDPARAVEEAAEALTLAPGFVEAYARRAAAEAALGRFEEAAADFGEALARDPGPPDFAAQILRGRRLASERARSFEGLAFPLSLEDLIEENRGR